APEVKQAEVFENIPFEITDDDSLYDHYLEQYYDDDNFLWFFKTPVPAPEFGFPDDLSDKSLVELQILKSEIYARRGYLFMGSVMRGHFNQYKWYQPIFWDENFRVILNSREYEFIQQVEALEKKHLEHNYIEQNGNVYANMDNVVNFIQFVSVPPLVTDKLKETGFAIIKANHPQLYQLYEQNYYDGIPNFVTTDIYVQLLHIYYKYLLKQFEDNTLIERFNRIATHLYESSIELANQSDDPVIAQAAKYNAAYFGITRTLFTGQDYDIPAEYYDKYYAELWKVLSHSTRGSSFLNDPYFDYTQFIPRGHYTTSEELEMYFAGVKWLQTAPFFIPLSGMNAPLSGAVLAAATMTDETVEDYRAIEKILRALIGEVDNLSLLDLHDLIKQEYPGEPVSRLLQPDRLEELRTRLLAMNPERIPVKHVLTAPRGVSLYVLPGRYTFDGEILIRLIDDTQFPPRRASPRGADVFAALGVPEAERVLLSVYREHEKWPSYIDSLKTLQRQFGEFGEWDATLYNKRMQTLKSLFTVGQDDPYFMQLDPWQTKNLQTALAGWTHIKHENLLYIKQPVFAEGGGGREIPPPNIVGYVEPNLAFWIRCLELLEKTEEVTQEYGIFTSVNNDLRGLLNFCITVSEKELKGIRLDEEEYERIKWMGGEFAKMTIKIKGTDSLPPEDPDSEIPLVIDVYTFEYACLEEAVGYANQLYVVVEMDGRLYLMRGAVLSYYEFIQPSANRLTDDEWKRILRGRNAPEIPEWIQPLMVPVRTQELRTKPTFRNLLGDRYAYMHKSKYK
ncbi:hypothetical protein AMJ80_10150, partial [bacterium SM23_31]